MRLRPLLCLALLLTATPVFAQEPPPPPPEDAGPPPDEGAPHAFDKQRFDAHMAELSTKIQLTAAQKPLWDAYVAVREGNIEAMAAHLKAWHGARSAEIPARLDQHLAMLNAEIDGLQREKQALAPLWAALSPEQRDTLNQAVAPHPHRQWGHRHGWGAPQ